MGDQMHSDEALRLEKVVQIKLHQQGMSFCQVNWQSHVIVEQENIWKAEYNTLCFKRMIEN